MAASSNSRRPMDSGHARIPLGEVHVIPERCKECGFCNLICPELAIYTVELAHRGGKASYPGGDA